MITHRKKSRRKPKRLNNSGQAELDLLSDELNNMLGRTKIVEQLIKALLSKVASIQKNQ